MEVKNDRFLFRLWTKESGLVGMLLLLLTMHFVLIPLFGSRSLFMIIVNVFWLLFLMAGIYSLSKDNQQAIRISAIPLLFVIVQWSNFFIDNPIVIILDVILSITVIILLITLVVKKIFEPGPISVYQVVGSIVVYMLLVNLWCIAYVFVFNHIGGAFQMNVSPFKMNSTQADFMYFSYIAISSTGFGEIVPVHPVARALVQAEVLVGVLYAVVVIGRLVSDANFSSKK